MTIVLAREGLSYTVDTLRELAMRYPGEEFLFLLGGDSLSHLSTWRDLEELFTRVEFLFVPRSGWGEERLPGFHASLAPELQALFRAQFLPMDAVDCSSTEIREALDAGIMPEDVPGPVAALIREQGLYGFGSRA